MEDAILRRVRSEAASWFPEIRGEPTVHLRQLVNRPRAVLYAVHLNGSSTPQVLAKLRRDSLAGEAGEWAGSRPRLAPAPLRTAEMVALEYAGLRAIEELLEPAHPDLAAVRPLAHLVDEDTILMDYVDAVTLRDLLLGQSRLAIGRIGPRSPDTDLAWRRVGEWLRLYQRGMPAAGLPARQETRSDLVERFAAYDEFLTARLGRRAAGDAARRGAELAAVALPERSATAVGHGDYAPRNVFVLRDSRLAVFDPMPRWAVPRFEDLSGFLVAARLLGIQLHTHGAAFSSGFLDRRERQLIEGYRGAGDLCLAQLRCHQLLMTLDRWSALVDTRPTSGRGRLRQLSVRMASGYLRRETRRLVELAETQLAGASPG